MPGPLGAWLSWGSLTCLGLRTPHQWGSNRAGSSSSQPCPTLLSHWLHWFEPTCGPTSWSGLGLVLGSPAACMSGPRDLPDHMTPSPSILLPLSIKIVVVVIFPQTHPSKVFTVNFCLTASYIDVVPGDYRQFHVVLLLFFIPQIKRSRTLKCPQNAPFKTNNPQ